MFVKRDTLILKLEDLIARISTAFVQLAPEQFDETVGQALAEVGQYAQCDRSYLFLALPQPRETFQQVFEWCGEGIPAQEAEYRTYDFESFPWWINTLRAGRPVIISRVDDLPAAAQRTRQIMADRGVRSALAVPMRLADRFVGFIGCNWSNQEKKIDDALVALFQFVANIVAGSLDRTQKEMDLQSQSARLHTLHLIDRAILATESPGATALAALRELENLIPYYLGVVLILDKETDSGSVLAYHSKYPERFAMLKHLKEVPLLGLEEAIAELYEGVVRVVEDLSIYANRSRLLAVAERIGIRAYINAPLLVEGELIGVIGLAASEPTVFSERQGEILGEVADSLAIGMHQAELYAQVRSHADRLERRVAERTAELSAANIELAQAARMKDEFLASMSHELRTPLNGVLGMAEALMEEVYGPISGEQLWALGGIRTSGRKLLALINDILDLAAMDSGQVVLDIEPIPASAVCGAAMSVVRGQLAEQGLTAKIELDPGVGIVEVDALRIQQLLLILLRNAIKFTPQGGAIGLDVIGVPDAKTVRFEVWDTGIGISVEDMHRLFKPFQQVDGRLNRRYGGMGLGLAMTSRLVELHGGTIQVKSESGRGSRFIVSLPWTPSGRGDAT